MGQSHLLRVAGPRVVGNHVLDCHSSRLTLPLASGAESVVYNPFPSLHTLRCRRAFATVGSTRNPANARGEELVVTINYTPLMHESSSSGAFDCLNTPHFRTMLS